MKKYVSISELVHMGYGSRSTIMRHLAMGGFTAINPGGGKWLIDLASYEEWLKDHAEDRQRFANWRKHYGCRKKVHC